MQNVSMVIDKYNSYPNSWCYNIQKHELTDAA